ncbi:hypothetical protein GCM10010275_42560 [Streptomyces litmocidini]|uniref:cbb3-type cytochrome c oxidase subunit I n=1 Tax=Streptomyces litmocidini TaxID=67318 RepID=UPI0019A43A3A|nr:hypothetical protein GCM10010275_42560 [Streptomyces litmocidini]
MAVSGLVVPGRAASFGWFAHAPLNGPVFPPGAGGDLWTMGLVLSGVGTTLTSVDLGTAIVSLRAPGMTMFRMPVFTWNVLLTSVLAVRRAGRATTPAVGRQAVNPIGPRPRGAGGAAPWPADRLETREQGPLTGRLSPAGPCAVPPGGSSPGFASTQPAPPGSCAPRSC